jgi:hypothetical protein
MLGQCQLICVFHLIPYFSARPFTETHMLNMIEVNPANVMLYKVSILPFQT